MDSAASCQSLGRPDKDPSELGAGNQSAPRPCVGNASAKDGCISRGGQASGPGLFGLRGDGPLFRRNPETRTATQGQAADDTTQRVGGLTFAQRKARLAALLGPVVPVPASNVARSGNVPTLILTGRRKEQAAAKQAAQVELSRAEKISVARYVESIELDEKEREAREGTTASMLAFAHASDQREAFCLDFDAHETAEAGCFSFAADCPAADPALAQD